MSLGPVTERYPNGRIRTWDGLADGRLGGGAYRRPSAPNGPAGRPRAAAPLPARQTCPRPPRRDASPASATPTATDPLAHHWATTASVPPPVARRGDLLECRRDPVTAEPGPFVCVA